MSEVTELEELKLSNLSKELEHERDWRVKEFSIIKMHFFSLSKGENESLFKAYARMTIPIIYAHWEGFCVSSFKLILKFINEKELNYDQVTNEVFTYSHDNTYNFLKGKQDFDHRCEFSKKFIESLQNGPISLNIKINTKSNLKFDILDDICKQIGMQTATFNKFQRDLDTLVNIRNAVAHGENSVKIDYTKIETYIKIIIELMDEFIVVAFDFIYSKKYLS